MSSKEEGIVTRRRRDAERDHRVFRAKIRDASRDESITESAKALRKLAVRIAALTPNVRQTDSTELIRDDRLR
jgi:hypothetical protein